MSARAQNQGPKAQDATSLRGLIDRVGSIDLIANIRAIREARDFLDSMLRAAESELSGRAGPIKLPALTLSSRAVAANKTRREAAIRAASTDTLQPGTVADWAAIAIRQAGRPLGGAELVKAIEEQGHKVKAGTLFGSLYRRIKKKSVFYLAGSGTFGLLDMKK